MSITGKYLNLDNPKTFNEKYNGLNSIIQRRLRHAWPINI